MNKTTFYTLTPSTSILSFSGKDASTFLQGQVTCDVLTIPQAGSLLGALCNHKGRVISTFQLMKEGNDFLMLLPKEMSEIVTKHLSKFIFRSQVKIQNNSDQFTVLGNTTTLNEEIQKALPTFSSRISVAHKPDVSILIYPESSLSLIQQSELIHVETTLENWHQALTNSCYPEINPDTSELFIPQMLNLDLLDGISFKKGCYTGQEIIARMHYKGSVKRRLVRYKSSQPYKPGNDIHQLNIANSIGTILSAYSNDDTNFYGLAVLKVETIQSSPLLLNDNSKMFIQSAEYALD